MTAYTEFRDTTVIPSMKKVIPGLLKLATAVISSTVEGEEHSASRSDIPVLRKNLHTFLKHNGSNLCFELRMNLQSADNALNLLDHIEFLKEPVQQTLGDKDRVVTTLQIASSIMTDEFLSTHEACAEFRNAVLELVEPLAMQLLESLAAEDCASKGVGKLEHERQGEMTNAATLIKKPEWVTKAQEILKSTDTAITDLKKAEQSQSNISVQQQALLADGESKLGKLRASINAETGWTESINAADLESLKQSFAALDLKVAGAAYTDLVEFRPTLEKSAGEHEALSTHLKQPMLELMESENE
eukprot:g24675.t1